MTIEEMHEFRQLCTAETEQLAKEAGFREGREARRRHLPRTANPHQLPAFVTDHFRAIGWDAGWDLEERQQAAVVR